MSSRVEFERSVTLAGEPVQLYVSCGSQDDYLELVLPEEPEREVSARQHLARLQESATDDLLDLRFSEGRPTTVSVLALYAGPEAAEWRARPHPERLASILARLARAEPAFDFGDLLPARLAVREPEPEPRSSSAATPSPRPSPSPNALDDGRGSQVWPLPSHHASSGGEAGLAAARPGEGSDYLANALAAAPQGPAPAAEPAARQAPRVAPVASTSHPELARPAPTVDYLSRAGELAARGRVHKALRAVEDALRQDSDDPAAWALREDLQLLERRERRRQREPRNAQAQLEVGFSYLTLGCDADAIAALREATRLEPDLYIAHLILGIALHHHKQAREARGCYERAARLRPSDGAPRELLRALSRGEPPPRPVEDRPAAQAGVSRVSQKQQWAAAI